MDVVVVEDSGVSQLWPVVLGCQLLWVLGLVGSGWLVVDCLIVWFQAWRAVDCYHKGRKGQKGHRRRGLAGTVVQFCIVQSVTVQCRQVQSIESIKSSTEHSVTLQ